MARASSIDLLPDNVRQKLQDLLRNPAITQLETVDQINSILTDMGHVAVSKSAVNRYSVKMNVAGEKLRQSREIAEMWIAKLGASPQGQMGHLVNEMLRGLAFELALKLQDKELNEDSLPQVIEMVRELSLAATRLEKASSENVKRESEIRKQEREKAAQELEARVTQEGTKTITPDRLREIVRETYGV